MGRDCRTTRGFTLIELLTVITILSLLAAVLLPVLGQVRAKARQANCLSNMKQIGLGLVIYAQDYDETLVPYRLQYPNLFHEHPLVGNFSKQHIFFNQLINPYIKNDQVWQCTARQGAWVNIDPEADPNDTVASYAGQNSYACNHYVFVANRGLPMARVARAADTVAIVDAVHYEVLPGGRPGIPCPLKGDPENPVDGIYYPQIWKAIGNPFARNVFAAFPLSDAEAMRQGKMRHQGSVNVVWLDGHAQAMRYAPLVLDDGLAKDTDRSIWDPFKQGCL